MEDVVHAVRGDHIGIGITYIWLGYIRARDIDFSYCEDTVALADIF